MTEQCVKMDNMETKLVECRNLIENTLGMRTNLSNEEIIKMLQVKFNLTVITFRK
jgi:hypothetical protein